MEDIIIVLESEQPDIVIVLEEGSGSFPEAPEDGKQYARIDGTWQEVASSSSASPKLNAYTGTLPLNEEKTITLSGINLDLVTSIATSNNTDGISFIIIDQSSISLTITAKASGNLDLIINTDITYTDYFNVQLNEGWQLLGSGDSYTLQQGDSVTDSVENYISSVPITQIADGLEIPHNNTDKYSSAKFNDFKIKDDEVVEFVLGWNTANLNNSTLTRIGLFKTSDRLTNFPDAVTFLNILKSTEDSIRKQELKAVYHTVNSTLIYGAENQSLPISNTSTEFNLLKFKFYKDGVSIYSVQDRIGTNPILLYQSHSPSNQDWENDTYYSPFIMKQLGSFININVYSFKKY